MIEITIPCFEQARLVVSVHSKRELAMDYLSICMLYSNYYITNN